MSIRNEERSTPGKLEPAGSIDAAEFGSIRKILTIAAPLVLSQMGVMLMQIVDGVFLARYSEAAIAAVGPAGMCFWLLCGLFIGVAGYTNTFVAQYIGARRPERVGAAVWQGVHLSAGAGVLLAVVAFGAGPLFAWIGHEPAIRDDEIVYFRILCQGGFFVVLSAAISGFCAGRHDNFILLVAHIVGGVTNAGLDAVLIFGRFGFPEMGIAGAAWASILGHAVQVLVLGRHFLRSRFRREFGTWRGRRPSPALLWRMLWYGFPNGVRYVIEIAAWTVFLLIIGRIDSVGLAASNIAWRINGMAFFPVIGLSIAIAMLVGQAQGAGRPDLARKATYRGFLVGQLWMTAAAAVMVLAPEVLLGMFFADGESFPQAGAIHDLTVKLLWFVAAYCLVDNFNIIFMAMLSGAGDTRWLLVVSGILHAGFIVVLVALAALGVGTFGLWWAATIFVFCAVIAWVMRFRSGAWEHQRVIEHAPPDLPNPALPGPAAGHG